MFYRVVRNDSIVDALKSPIIKLKFQTRSDRWILLDSDNYDGVLSRDGSFIWVVNNSLSSESVVLSEITEDEYKAIVEALDSSDREIIEYEKPSIVVDDITLEFIKSSKIDEMSDMCNMTIVSGVDVTLSSGDVEHFDLTHDDQINIIELVDYVRYENVKYAPYHSRGGTCRIYTAEDIMLIAEASRKFKMINTTYFNNLRDWINSMDTIDEVRSVFYGIDIPDDKMSDIFKSIVNS